jgi:hypothetical protein
MATSTPGLGNDEATGAPKMSIRRLATSVDPGNVLSAKDLPLNKVDIEGWVS